MNKKAFTLIELLVVIAIIGVLAAMAILAMNSTRAKARDARRVADVRQMRTALELYSLDQNSYPGATLAAWSSVAGLCLSTSGWATTCVTTTYMGVAPTAPTPVETGCTAGDNSYSYSASASTYSLKYCLGSTVGGLVAGVHTASHIGMSY